MTLRFFSPCDGDLLKKDVLLPPNNDDIVQCYRIFAPCKTVFVYSDLSLALSNFDLANTDGRLTPGQGGFAC